MRLRAPALLAAAVAVAALTACTGPSTTATTPAGKGDSTDSSGSSREDAVAPTLTIDTPEDGAELTSTPVTVTGTAQDTDSGIDQVFVLVDGIVTTPVALTGTAYSADIDVPAGVHTISVRASDLAGNDVTLDRAVTVAQTEQPTPADEATGKRHKDGKTAPQTPAASPSATQDSTRRPTVPSVKPTPPAPTATPTQVAIDRTAPTLDVTTPMTGASVNLAVDGGIVVTGTARDTDSGIAKVEVVVDGVDAGNAPLARNGDRVSFTWTVPAKNGQRSVVIRAFDREGNFTRIERPVTVTSPSDHLEPVLPG